MIICSCNIICDQKVKNCIANLENPTVGMIFKELKCKPECATCVASIVKVLEEHKNSSRGVTDV